MPAARDLKLLKGHFTNEQKEQKAKNKASTTPSVKLKAPRVIRENLDYYRIWKDTMKLYRGTDLLNALDTGLLARYCVESAKLESLYILRDRHYCFMPEDAAPLDGWTDEQLKIEGRIDSKTKMLNQMALALYMTPRARAGAVPQKPDKEAQDDPNGEMFD